MITEGMKMELNCYFTFSTVHLALRAESVLKGIACSFRLIPVPRFLSSNCGVALQCRSEEADTIKSALEQNRVSFEQMHIVDENESSH